jgi:hypothetical protein
MTKITKYREQAIEDFTKPERVYSEVELQDFHNKVQRFWREPKEVVLSNGLSGTAQKFDHEELAVAFGAARRVAHGVSHVYQYNSERNEKLQVLWGQYVEWRKKKDWIVNKQVEAYEHKK